LVVLGAYNFDTTKNRTQQWLKGVQEQQRTLARTAKSLYLQGFQDFCSWCSWCSWYFSLLNKNNNFIVFYYVFI
jgi:hypothetical protein